MDDRLMLRDVVAAIKTQRLVVAASTALGLLLALAVNYLETPTYESSSSVLVMFGRETYGSEGGESSRPSINRDSVTLVNAELEIIGSPDLILSVVEELGPSTLYPELLDPPGWLSRILQSDERAQQIAQERRAAERFRESYSVQAVPDAAVIRVFFRHDDPEMAASALQLLMATFTEMHLDAFSDPQATEFLEEQVESLRKELEVLDRTLGDFRASNRMFAHESPGQLLLGQREQLTQELGKVNSAISGFEKKLDYLSGELERSSRASRYEGVDMAPELERQIVSARADLQFQRATGKQVRTRLGRVNAQLAQLPRQNKEFADIVRDREAVAKAYSTYSAKVREARISDDMNSQKMANIRVIQNPLVPLKPIRPRKALNLVVGFGAGLLMGSVLGYFLGIRRQKGEDAAEPVAPPVDVIRGEQTQKASRKRRSRSGPGR